MKVVALLGEPRYLQFLVDSNRPPPHGFRWTTALGRRRFPKSRLT